mgnify:CR=1 FL=1
MCYKLLILLVFVYLFEFIDFLESSLSLYGNDTGLVDRVLSCLKLSFAAPMHSVHDLTRFCDVKKSEQ